MTELVKLVKNGLTTIDLIFSQKYFTKIMNVESCQSWQYFTAHIVTIETLQKWLIAQTSQAAFLFLLIITK